MKYVSGRRVCTISLVVSLGLMVLLLFGCSRYNNVAVFSKPVTDHNAILYTPWNPTKKVCVLPFENLSKESDADLKVMEIFLTELFSGRIFEDIVDPVQANAALMGLRIRKPNSLDKETIKALGERLDVQYLILGTVTDYTYGKNKGSAAQVGLNVRMLDVETGNILWTGNSFKDGSISAGRIFGFTDGPNPAKLSKEACLHIINSLQSQIRKSSPKKSFWNIKKAESKDKADELKENKKEQEQKEDQEEEQVVINHQDSVEKRR